MTHCTFFPGSLTRKLYRKKITEMALNVSYVSLLRKQESPKLRENPVDLFPAFYPVKCYFTVKCNLTSDPVLARYGCGMNSHTLSSYEYQNREKYFQLPGSGQRQAVQPGIDGVWVVLRDLSRRSSCIRTPAFQSFFNVL